MAGIVSRITAATSPPRSASSIAPASLNGTCANSSGRSDRKRSEKRGSVAATASPVDPW